MQRLTFEKLDGPTAVSRNAASRFGYQFLNLIPLVVLTVIVWINVPERKEHPRERAKIEAHYLDYSRLGTLSKPRHMREYLVQHVRWDGESFMHHCELYSDIEPFGSVDQLWNAGRGVNSHTPGPFYRSLKDPSHFLTDAQLPTSATINVTELNAFFHILDPHRKTVWNPTVGMGTLAGQDPQRIYFIDDDTFNRIFMIYDNDGKIIGEK
jgi:hypothetical protein